MQKYQLGKKIIKVVICLIVMTIQVRADTLTVNKPIAGLNTVINITENYTDFMSTIFYDAFHTQLRFNIIKGNVHALVKYNGGNTFEYFKFNSKYHECIETKNNRLISRRYIDSKSYKKDSILIYYHRNGMEMSTIMYEQEKQVGKHTVWDSLGNKVLEALYCRGATYDGKCNCMVINDCLGNNYTICYPNEWYKNGLIKYKLSTTDTVNIFIYTKYDISGKIIYHDKLELGKVHECVSAETFELKSIYFLKKKN